MNFVHNIICPVSFTKIDNNLSRLTVFLNACLLVAYIVTGFPLFVFMVALDYGIRVFWKPEYSLLRWIASQIINTLKISPKLTGQSPKMFAARLGFLFSFTSSLLFLISPAASLVPAGILLVFTILDSVFDICAGCITYSYVVLPFYQFMGIREQI